MDHRGLKDFLYSRISRPDGVLQKFITPEGRHNEVVQAVWSPCGAVQLVTKRQNTHAHNDRRTSMHDRSVTFEGPTHLSREAFLAPHIQWLVKRQCGRFIMHFHSTEQVHIQRMVLHFKVDGDGELWLLWGSSVRIHRAGREHPLDLTNPYVSAESVNRWRVTQRRSKGELPANLVDGSGPDFGTVDEEDERIAQLLSEAKAESDFKVIPTPTLGRVGDMSSYRMKSNERCAAVNKTLRDVEQAYLAAVQKIEAMRYDDATWEREGRVIRRGRRPYGPSSPRAGATTPPPQLKEVFRVDPGARTGSRRLKKLTSTLTLLAKAQEQQKESRIKAESEEQQNRDRRGSVWVPPAQLVAAGVKPRRNARASKVRRRPALQLKMPIMQPRLRTRAKRDPGVAFAVKGPVVYDNEEFRTLAGGISSVPKSTVREVNRSTAKRARRRWAALRGLVRSGSSARLRWARDIPEWVTAAKYSMQAQFIRGASRVRVGMPKPIQSHFGMLLETLLTDRLRMSVNWDTVRTLSKEERPAAGLVGSALVASLFAAIGRPKQRRYSERTMWLSFVVGDVTVVEISSTFDEFERVSVAGELRQVRQAYKMISEHVTANFRDRMEQRQSIAATSAAAEDEESSESLDPFASVEAMWKGVGSFNKPEEFTVESEGESEPEPPPLPVEDVQQTATRRRENEKYFLPPERGGSTRRMKREREAKARKKVAAGPKEPSSPSSPGVASPDLYDFRPSTFLMPPSPLHMQQ
eukprot:TRINITY_DN3630_c1_g2_i1.p1 TRINITY_DN3630_c1_g2~~TRINITY_DN3630_c1_g2_i1.p1  ORF type:complete len:750 (+),score=279.79 TRINITY_DN3630_c1_g2_i1:664-2913(+)